MAAAARRATRRRTSSHSQRTASSSKLLSEVGELREQAEAREQALGEHHLKYVKRCEDTKAALKEQLAHTVEMRRMVQKVADELDASAAGTYDDLESKLLQMFEATRASRPPPPPRPSPTPRARRPRRVRIHRSMRHTSSIAAFIDHDARSRAQSRVLCHHHSHPPLGHARGACAASRQAKSS